MSGSFFSQLRSCFWLVGRQVRQLSREMIWMMGLSLALSLVTGGLLLHLSVMVDNLHPGTQSGSRVHAMPATRVVVGLAHWLDRQQGEPEEDAGALSGARIWVGCDAVPQCAQGRAWVESVGAQVVSDPAQAMVHLEWQNDRWEVSAPHQPKYSLPAAVVLHSAAHRSSPQALYGDFEGVEVVSEKEGDPAQFVEATSRSLIFYILVLALLLPSLQLSVLGTSQLLSSTSIALDKGAFEPYVLAPLPPWVLFLSRALGMGVLSFLFCLGLAVLVQAFVGPIHPVNVLAFSLSMGGVSVLASMTGLTVLTAFYSRIMRLVVGHLTGPLPLLMFGVVFSLGSLVSALGANLLEGQGVASIPLLEWSAFQGLVFAGLVVGGCVLGVGVLVRLGRSGWGHRRPGLRSTRT